MSFLLILFILLEVFALALLWLVRAPDRVLVVFVVLAFVPLGLGNMHGQALPASYLLIPGATLLYLVDRFRRSGRPEPARSGRNWIWLVAILFFAAVFLHFVRKPILIGDLASMGRNPAGIHGWMGFLLATCYFIVFSGVTFRAPRSTAKTLHFMAWLCLALTVFGVALVHLPPLHGLLDRAKEVGLFRSSFYGADAGSDLLDRYRDRSGGYHLGTLGIVASVLLVYVLASGRSTLFKLLAAVGCLGAVLQSGMRAEFAGAAAGFFAWSVFARKPRIALALAAVAGGVLIYVTTMADDVAPLFRRTTTLITGEGFEHEPRVELFRRYVDSIEEHPWIGAGIGDAKAYEPDDPFAAFLHSNIRFGGHGTYISVLYLFGLAGFVTFMVILGLSLISSHRLARTIAPPYARSLALFAFLFLVYFLFPMGIAGNGSSRIMFAVFGIVSGLAARDWSAEGRDMPEHEPAPVPEPAENT